MSKHEAIARITAVCAKLGAAHVAEIEQFASDMLGPSVYSTLPESERLKIDSCKVQGGKSVLPAERTRATQKPRL